MLGLSGKKATPAIPSSNGLTDRRKIAGLNLWLQLQKGEIYCYVSNAHSCAQRRKSQNIHISSRRHNTGRETAQRILVDKDADTITFTTVAEYYPEPEPEAIEHIVIVPDSSWSAYK